ncbi:MAG: sigma-54-dependent Fis family transcriptional regulator, partial [Acidobacteria bacterium]|nr:sigma-54-dependent Fis family transcriptional regulator [Acidobacteriota bacterium]
EPRRVSVNVIAATNRDLRAEVAAGRFRSDLYYRLNVVEVKLPALRERREDIPYLTAAFVREANERLQKAIIGLTPGAEGLLATAPWEGNVRELRNVLERASILTDGDFITERELASSLPHASYMAHASLERFDGDEPVPAAGAGRLVDVEREHIQRALVRAGGNKKAAAKMLGVSRRALYRRLERLELSATITRRRDAAALMV